MGSELIYRGHEAQPASDSHSPKPVKPRSSVIWLFRYMLRGQRLLFLLVGIAIATLIFRVFPTSCSPHFPHHHFNTPISDSIIYCPDESQNKFSYAQRLDFGSANPTGKIPWGLKRKGLWIVVTSGARFMGSHLVDRLMARGGSVIVVDNFFTGKKGNVMHHFGSPNFELIRHDVVEPLLFEVDQIYHLACPASPVHYKFNPVKTIKTSVAGMLNMLGLAKRVGGRFLLTSTSEVYGDPLQHPQKETYWGNVNSIGIRSCYDEGKRTAETVTIDYHRGVGI